MRVTSIQPQSGSDIARRRLFSGVFYLPYNRIGLSPPLKNRIFDLPFDIVDSGPEFGPNRDRRQWSGDEITARNQDFKIDQIQTARNRI